jgi:hypothetical protein
LSAGNDVEKRPCDGDDQEQAGHDATENDQQPPPVPETRRNFLPIWELDPSSQPIKHFVRWANAAKDFRQSRLKP